MRRGPKLDVTAPPLDLSKMPRHRGARAVAFIEKYVRVPKGKGARGRFKVRPWQRRIIYDALKPGVRSGLLSIARGNGKTTLCAAMAVAGLFEGVEGAQILCVASDQRQAAILLNTARRMIELSPELFKRCQIFQDRIYVPHTDSVLTALPAEPDALLGFDPTLALVDELAVVTEPVWDAVVTASGKRDKSLVLAMSTAAVSKDSVMWKLTEHGRAGSDKQFFFAEFTAPDVECPLDDLASITAANPAYGDFLSPDGLDAVRKTIRPEVYRRLRLNQHVGQVGSWLEWGSWDACAEPRLIDPEEPVVLGFDGSISDDSTALIGCTVTAPHHIFTVRLWESDAPGWRVPRSEVSAEVDRAFETYNVVELACDPWHWQSEEQAWADKHKNVLEWPTNAIPRMAPATDRLAAAVMDGAVTHDGNEALARHVGNAIVKSTSHGDVVVKDRRGSPRKIDGAVAAIVAHDRAVFHLANPPKRYRVLAVV